MAEWAADLDYEDLPHQVRSRTTEILVDAIASAMAGRSASEAAMIGSVGRSLGAGGGTVIGGPIMGIGGAVLLNGYQITASTVCDVYRPSSCHTTPEVLPPALAVAEAHNAKGSTLITALAVGLEITTRVGVGLGFPAFRARGWHSPGVIGPFGGAAAVARILDLDAEKTRAALGLAGSQSAGTRAQYGTPTIKFHQSRGALSGYLAGTLAAEGFLSSAEIFTHPDGGILNTYSDGGDPEAMVRDLGSSWELEQISLRPWPAASAIQSVVAATIDLIRNHDVRPDDIHSLRIGLAETPYKRHGEMPWDDRFKALLSARYCCAVTLFDRRCWLDQFEPTRVADPNVGSFARDRITVSLSDEVPDDGARLNVMMTNGEEVRIDRDVPKGDPRDPLSREELVEKFSNASEGVIGARKCEEALAMLFDIEHLDDVGQLCRLLAA
jgi:2-methylcitrate dehydratase PrpD